MAVPVADLTEEPAAPVVTDDPLEKLLAEEEEIERRTREQHHDVPAFPQGGRLTMLMPRKVKHRKQQRGRMSGMTKGGETINFGDFGIQALEPAWLTARQIEAARIAMTRHIKRGGKVWIRVFPDKPVTQKPAETRMGSGKGNPEHWVAVVRPGGSSSSWPASTRRSPIRPSNGRSRSCP